MEGMTSAVTTLDIWNKVFKLVIFHRIKIRFHIKITSWISQESCKPLLISVLTVSIWRLVFPEKWAVIDVSFSSAKAVAAQTFPNLHAALRKRLPEVGRETFSRRNERGNNKMIENETLSNVPD